MKALRNIICIAKDGGVPFVYTVDGHKYFLDDITLDGLLYNGYNWNTCFTSNEDLNIIMAYKAREELEEIIYSMSHKRRVRFNI